MKNKLTKHLDKIIFIAIWLSLIFAFILSVITKNWGDVIVSIITGVIIWLPKLLPNKFNIMVPKRFIVIIILFLFTSLFLGEFGDFYEKLWWWDLLLHSFSAFAFGILGILGY